MRNPAQTRKKKAMALPLTLVVLLVVGALVGVSLYLIENMKTTTEMKIHDEARLNAALAGVERGKQWIYDKLEDNEAPALIAAGSIEEVTKEENFKELLVKSGHSAPNPTFEFKMGELDIYVRIYDLSYDPGANLEFVSGIPPRMYRTRDNESLKAGQSYASSNVGEGDLGAHEAAKKILKAYLVRAEARDEKSGISKHVEQAVFVTP